LQIDAALFAALAAAFSYACADMAARAGLQRTNAFVGSTIALASSLFFLSLVILIQRTPFPAPGTHYLWVVAGGACNPGMFFIFFLIGISKIGVSRAAPIKGTSPLLGALLAILILSERPSWVHLVGVLFVVCGIAVITSGGTGERFQRRDILWPIAAAVASSFAAVFWRAGLPAFPDPIAASTVGVLTALVVVAAYTAFAAWGEISEGVRRAWKPFLLCGLVAACGYFFYAKALQLGEVYRMLPLIQTSPLITVVFSIIWIRKTEDITWRVPVGAVLSVGGAILVNLRWGGV
jgi:drug/metabolite transporter (DMT)-like permease|tara:strand:- start:98 stop:976 length:879 start_codon:yes stop_codon:yes gene_type:complete